MMAGAEPKTPVRHVLLEHSTLQAAVKNGMTAVAAAHRNYFDEGIRTTFADSLELDAAMLEGHEQENRWDYLLGHSPSGTVIGVEPHSAKQDEISTVIAKRAAAIQHLTEHLRDGQHVTKWLWVASGKVHFANTEKAKLKLDQNGIEFAGKLVSAKHLPEAKIATKKAPSKKPRPSRNR